MYAMSLPRTKRVKQINPDGTEEFKEEDRWALVQAVHSGQDGEVKQGRDGGNKAEKSTAAAPALPIEVIEKLQMARGEINMLLDLVSSLEAQQHMGMANIPPQSSTLQQLTRQRDLHLQAKACQLKDAAKRLKQGAGSLTIHLEREERYFKGLAQLAQEWHLRPAPEFTFQTGAAPYLVDLRIPGAQPPPAATVLVDLNRDSDGNVQIADGAGAAVVGYAAVDAALRAWQKELLWSCLQASLEEEAKAAGRGSALQVLASEVVHAVQVSQAPQLQELGALLMKAYVGKLTSRDAEEEKLLPKVAVWLRHQAFSAHVWKSLHDQVSALRDQRPEVKLAAVHVPGFARSAVRVAIGAQSVLLILEADTLRLAGCLATAQLGSRLAGDTVYVVGKQQLGGLLHRLIQEAQTPDSMAD